jgi:hypothetical protein
MRPLVLPRHDGGPDAPEGERTAVTALTLNYVNQVLAERQILLLAGPKGREDSIGGAGRRQSALAGTCDQAALNAPWHPPARGLPFGAAMAATVLFFKPALGFVVSVGALTSLMLFLASIG